MDIFPAAYYRDIAAGHARKAAAATNPAERDHWEAEAVRFSTLAIVAKTNPARARDLYRPTPAYQPEA